MDKPLITETVIEFLKDYKAPRTWVIRFKEYRRSGSSETDICDIFVKPRRHKKIQHRISISEFKVKPQGIEQYLIYSSLQYLDKSGRVKTTYRVRSFRTSSHHTLLDDIDKKLGCIRHDIMVLNQYKNADTIKSKKILARIHKDKSK